MKVQVLIRILTVMFAGVLVGRPAHAATSVSIERIGDASHLEFSGRTDWKYDMKRDGNRVTLSVGGLDLSTLNKLKAYKDTTISGVKVDENGVDGRADISFAVTDQSDFFDYLSDAPSRLIVDFFPKEAGDDKASKKANTAAKKTADSSDASIEAAGKKLAKSAKGGAISSERDISSLITGLPKKATRSPAASDLPLINPQADVPSLAERLSEQKDFSHGIFDGGDPEFKRFQVKDYEISEDAIFKSRGNFYLPFPMLDLGNPQLKAMIDAPPTYEIVPNDTKENKQARVILSLFSAGLKQRALFFVTSAEFLKKYPQSQYDEMIRYMVADTREQQWHEQGNPADFETAMTSYQSLSEKYPDSPITPRTLLFIGYSFMDRGDSFGALKAFQRFTRSNPTSKYLDEVNIAVAEAYLKLNRYDDAMKMLEQIEESAKSPKARQEAAFRKGDVEFRRKQWGPAIAKYRETLKKYPDAVSRFPNAYYNISEAEFTKGDYRAALDDYRLFLTKFPDHDHGGYAMTRIGEIIGILGADAKRAQGAFMESYFRYRATPGAGIARIRLLVSRFADMKDKELKDGLKEIAAITESYVGRPESARKPASETASSPAPKVEAKKEEGEKKAEAPKAAAAEPEVPKGENLSEHKPVLPGIEEFTNLLLADGFNSRKDYDHAKNDLVSYYQKNPVTPNKDRIVQRIAKNICDAIGASVDQGNFMDGLRRFGKDRDGWLKNTERVDVRFDIGRAYEQAGVTNEAAKSYTDCLKRLETIHASKQDREHSIYEDLPKNDAVNLRLAVISLKDKNYAGSEKYLKAIGSPAALTQGEQIERAETNADVAEARGQAPSAKKYLADLISTWKGDAELTSPLHYRIARLSGAAKNYKDADAHLAKILDMKRENDKVPDEVVAKALELRGDLLVARGDRANAVKAYSQLLNDYGTKRPVASVRYRLGQLLYEDGDIKGASAAWNELKPEKDGMWAKLATEQMQGAKWQKEYKKYLNRIPAASELR